MFLEKSPLSPDETYKFVLKHSTPSWLPTPLRKPTCTHLVIEEEEEVGEGERRVEAENERTNHVINASNLPLGNLCTILVKKDTAPRYHERIL